MAASKKASRKATTKKVPGKATTKTSVKVRAKKAAAAARKPVAKVAKKAAPKKRASPAPDPARRMGTAGKAEGDAPVAAFIAKLRHDHRAIAEKVDGLVGREVPDVKRAIKWNTPFYGREGKGWFLSVASFSKQFALVFHNGTQYEPLPPVAAGKTGRRINYASVADVDEAQLADWIRQGASLPGWGK
jgi:hypothetical protein